MPGDAPTHDLSSAVLSNELTSIEYPAPISSLPLALSTLTPLSDIAQTLSTPSSSSSISTTPTAFATATGQVELDLMPHNPYFHKVPALLTRRTANLVVRVTKRKRKVPTRDERGNVVQDGIYSFEPVGVETNLVRFRAMADFQYVPEHSKSDPTLQLVDSIRNLDVKGIRSFRMPPPNEDFARESFIPPPVFSRHGLPQNFDFRPAGGAVRITTDSGLTRLVNSTRYKARTMQSILFVSPRDAVPTGPDRAVLSELGRTEPTRYEARIRQVLLERPVWTRTALLNQLDIDEVKHVNNTKSVWPMVGYTFADGPFRDMVIRFGYDPRTDPQARFYQHFVFRNSHNVRSKALPGTRFASQALAAMSRHGIPSGTRGGGVGGGAGGGDLDGSNLSHTFDGQRVYGKIGNFQLVDISDPLARALIDRADGVLSRCSPDPNEGWYAFDYLEQIKQVVRRKWVRLQEEGGGAGRGGGEEGGGGEGGGGEGEFDDLLGWELSKESRALSGGGGGGGDVVDRGARSGQARSRAARRTRGGSMSGQDEDVESDDGGGGRGRRSAAGKDKGKVQGKDQGKAKASRSTTVGRDGDESEDSAVSTESERSRGSRGGEQDEEEEGDEDDDDDDDPDGREGDGAEEDDDEDRHERDGREGSRASVGRDGADGVPDGKKGPRRTSRVIRAPWELPKKKRRRAKQAETEEDMLVRLQRKTRRGTTTGPSQLG
ncbi:hypothetical protein JCM10212_007056 [Sporobolomyces blumeae]